MKYWFKDDWEDEMGRLVKMGRLTQEDARTFEEFFRRRRTRPSTAPKRGAQVPSWQHKVMQVRADTVSRNVSEWFSNREVMCKVISSSKTISGVKGTIAYIAKAREDEGSNIRPALYNGDGQLVGFEQTTTELDKWNLLKDDENFSKSARQLHRNGNFSEVSALDERSRFGRVQGYHLAFSIDRRETDHDDLHVRLAKAFSKCVTELFTQEQHNVLWAVHNDVPAHPHVHVVLQARSARGRQIRFDREGDYIHYLRIVMARHLQQESLPFTASRREDRFPLRARIIDGYEQLRPGWNIRDRKRPLPSLRKRAGPAFPYLRFRSTSDQGREKDHAFGRGTKKSKNHIGLNLMKALGFEKHKDQWMENVHPAYWPLAISKVYAEPERTNFIIGLFCSSDKTNKAYAAWLMKRNPTLFGPLADKLSQDRSEIEFIAQALMQGPAFRPNSAAKNLQNDESESILEEHANSRKRAKWSRSKVIWSIMRVAEYWRHQDGGARIADLILKELVDSLENSEIIKEHQRRKHQKPQPISVQAAKQRIEQARPHGNRTNAALPPLPGREEQNNPDRALTIKRPPRKKRGHER